MVLHNPNNWHWVNKDASVWTKQWLDDNLTKIESKEGDVTAKISKVVSMEGDVDVAQRKGKVITIFDVKLTLEYSGTYFHRIEAPCSASLNEDFSFQARQPACEDKRKKGNEY
jgi:activator of HSP90 ATPase